jgi:hypothetical protein
MSYLELAKKIQAELKPAADSDSETVVTNSGGRVVQNHDPIPPTCWNCGATMTRTKDISGKPWWACWACAKTA